MDIKQLKYELQNLISGKSSASYDALIQIIVKNSVLLQEVRFTKKT